MARSRIAGRVGTACGLIGLLAISGLVIAWTQSDGVPAHAVQASTGPEPPVAEWVPDFVSALRRSATPDESRVGATTPATETRLVKRSNGEDVYIGSVADANALCISVETLANQQIGTGCGGDKAIRSAQLFMGRGSAEEARRLYAGVVPPGVTAVRLLGTWGETVVPVESGIYVTRTVSFVDEIQFLDEAGVSTQILKVPRVR